MNVANITPISTSEIIYVDDAEEVEEPIQIVIHPQIIVEEQIVSERKQFPNDETTCCCDDNCCCFIIIMSLISLIIALAYSTS